MARSVRPTQHFRKYHGLGNDFVIVDLREGDDPERPWQDPANVRQICDRHFGVGADGVLAVLPPSSPTAAATMRVLNADGSEAEMCGNGLRCVVKDIYERMPELAAPRITIDTGAGPLTCDVIEQGGVVQAVTVDMGAPRLERGLIPMTGPAKERCLVQALPLEGVDLMVTAVSMGNPHAVTFVDSTGAQLMQLAREVGPRIEHHPWFPQRTNVEFAVVHDATHIELVVWERGCGITLACGTGACATAVAATLAGHCQPNTDIEVTLPGGPLSIRVTDDSVLMTGPVAHVFDAHL